MMCHNIQYRKSKFQPFVKVQTVLRRHYAPFPALVEHRADPTGHGREGGGGRDLMNGWAEVLVGVVLAGSIHLTSA